MSTFRNTERERRRCHPDSHGHTQLLHNAAIPRVIIGAVICLLVYEVHAVDARDQLREALLARSKDWAPGAVDDLASSIMHMQDQLHITLSPRHIQDIVAGIKEPTWGHVVSEWQHPITQEWNKLQVLHGVRQYLVLGPGTSASRASALTQVKELLQQWRDDVSMKYPNHVQVVQQAADQAIRSIESKSHNLLRRDFMRPVPQTILQRSHARFKTKLLGFRFEKGQEPTKQVFLAKNLLLRSLADFRRASKGPVVPFSQALINAETKLMKNISRVSEWEQRAYDRRSNAKAETRAHRSLLADMGASAQDTLDHLHESVEAITDVGASLEVDVPSDVSPKVETHANALGSQNMQPSVPNGTTHGIASAWAHLSTLGYCAATVIVIVVIGLGVRRLSGIRKGGKA